MGKKKKTTKKNPAKKKPAKKKPAATKPGTALAPRKAEQAAALKLMNPALRKIADDIRGRLSRLRDQGVITFYEIGVLVGRAVGDRGKYGDHALDKLSASLTTKHGANILRYARTFKDKYSKKEVRDASTAAERNGNEVTQSHWVEFCQRPKAIALIVLKSVIKDGWTVLDTRNELRRLDGSSTRNAPQGRKPASPKTETAGLQQISRFHRDVGSRIGLYTEFVFDPLVAREGTNITDDLISQVESTESDCLDTYKMFADLAKTCANTAAKMKKAKKEGKAPTARKPGRMTKPKAATGGKKRSNARDTAKQAATVAKKKKSKKTAAARPAPA